MEKQQLTNQRGEVLFRRKLYKQQVEGESIFDDEFDATGVESILKLRMDTTRANMEMLKQKGIPLEPYLEIGAERGQRSLVMENDMNLRGFAADISFDMLKSASHYGKVYDMTRQPHKICCDANQLPFKSNSIPFVFCYETLHHFPDPTPIINEIHRVLMPGGYFFFDEEPFNQTLKWYILKERKIYSNKSLNRNQLQRVIDYFFRKPACNEVDHDIIENHQVSIKNWKKALSIFQEKDLRVSTVKSIGTDAFKTFSIKYFIAYLLGGAIGGLCRKVSNSEPVPIDKICICPECYVRDEENTLISTADDRKCPNCNNEFDKIDGVQFLLSRDQQKNLYPEHLIIE